MRIAINTSCAVAGGAITHLRNLLPEMKALAKPGELVVIGDSETRRRIEAPADLEWEETGPIEDGLVGRLRFENRRLPRMLESLQADVLFHPGNFAAFRAGIPQVILIHNLAPFLPAVIAGESFHQRLRLRLLNGLTRISLRQAWATIFISEWGRAQVVSEAALKDSRMPVIPFGAEHGVSERDTAVLDRMDLESGRFVLTVSHLYRYKKLEKLIEAWVDLGEAVADLPLVIAGAPYDEGYALRLRQLADRCLGRVVFTGGLDSATIGALMADCRLFVFTSEAENLPITLLEAMAAGCPIVSTRACSMPEVCGDAAAYVDPPTADRYREILARLLDDSQARSELARRARERAAAFTWRRAASDTLSLLRRAGGE